MFSQQSEKLLPLAGRAGDDFFEQESPGGIQNDGGIGEPPIHVNGAANTLKLILHPGRKSDFTTPDRLRFPGGRFSDHYIPGSL